MGAGERIEELERRLEDLRVRRIMVEKEVNALRRKAAMSPANPHLRRDLDRAERELAKVLREEEEVREELERSRKAAPEAAPQAEGEGEKGGG